MKHLRSDDVLVSFDAGADNPVSERLADYFSLVMKNASIQGVKSVRISSTTNHPTNRQQTAHSLSNGARALDINYVNGEHVSFNNSYAKIIQEIACSATGFRENFGPFIVDKYLGNGNYKTFDFSSPPIISLVKQHNTHIHLSVGY